MTDVCLHKLWGWLASLAHVMLAGRYRLGLASRTFESVRLLRCAMRRPGPLSTTDSGPAHNQCVLCLPTSAPQVCFEYQPEEGLEFYELISHLPGAQSGGASRGFQRGE